MLTLFLNEEEKIYASRTSQFNWLVIISQSEFDLKKAFNFRMKLNSWLLFTIFHATSATISVTITTNVNLLKIKCGKVLQPMGRECERGIVGTNETRTTGNISTLFAPKNYHNQLRQHNPKDLIRLVFAVRIASRKKPFSNEK